MGQFVDVLQPVEGEVEREEILELAQSRESGQQVMGEIKASQTMGQ